MKYLLILAVLGVGAAGWFAFWDFPDPKAPAAGSPAAADSPPAAASAEEVKSFCSLCHAYPAPDSFPRSHWRMEVRRGYDFFFNSKYRLTPPDMEAVTQYYLRHAPETLSAGTTCPQAAKPFARDFQAVHWSPANKPALPQVTHVHLARLFADSPPVLVVCHAQPGRVWAVKPNEQPPSWQLLAEPHAPAHAEVADVDGDGIPDVLIADMGNMHPSDELQGSLLLLRGQPNGQFAPITLLEGVGRVTDVRAADFNGDGKIDLAVAVFGWQRGQLMYLENRTAPGSAPAFHATVLDQRSGAIHVPVADINGDGHLDIVALFSQEHETVAAFLGDGRGGFTTKTLYAAPHPAFGSSGIQLVDMDKDGDLDVLYTNGDNLDPPFLLKPYHGVHWLENRGQFPFTPHHITTQFGVMNAAAADLDGDGDQDIVAVSFLPDPMFPGVKAKNLETVLLLEQVAPGRFERHVLASGAAHSLTCAIGDVFGTGQLDIVLGAFLGAPTTPPADLVTIYKNQRTKK